jgi:hypothetical protein
MGVGHGVFRLSVWPGACEHVHDQPPCSSAPLQSMPAVASRRLPCGSRRGRWRHARGKSASDSKGAAAHLVAALGLRRGFRDAGRGWGPERAPGLGLGDQIVRAGVASGVRGHRGDSGLTSPPGGGEACARLRANCVDRAPGGARTARISLAGACRSGRQRAVVGRSQRRRSRDPLGA